VAGEYPLLCRNNGYYFEFCTDGVMFDILETVTGLDTLLDTSAFIELFQPRPNLIIVGGVHIAIALCSYARTLGMRVTMIDPRRAFASPERFPEIQISHQFPDEALSNILLGEQTFIVILTHDPKIDDPAVIAGLNHKFAYIGVLSSNRVHQQRLERIREAGISEQHAPIVLSIGAKTPEEIAVAIMAQIIQAKNARLEQTELAVASRNSSELRHGSLFKIASRVLPTQTAIICFR
jgi:xanthine/CO dehydrogenase XdhC/CoxF family maturation factor